MPRRRRDTGSSHHFCVIIPKVRRLSSKQYKSGQYRHGAPISNASLVKQISHDFAKVGFHVRFVDEAPICSGGVRALHAWLRTSAVAGADGGGPLPVCPEHQFALLVQKQNIGFVNRKRRSVTGTWLHIYVDRDVVVAFLPVKEAVRGQNPSVNPFIASVVQKQNTSLVRMKRRSVTAPWLQFLDVEADKRAAVGWKPIRSANAEWGACPPASAIFMIT